MTKVELRRKRYFAMKSNYTLLADVGLIDMTGKATRSKGRRGESEAKLLLESRDYVVADLSAGLSSEDLLVTDPDGKPWACEVKNTKAITVQHRKQAIEQAKKRRAAWMLLSKIDGTGAWLVQRQGHKPVVWGVSI